MTARRDFLRLTTAAAATALPVAARAAEHPDAELIAACDAFERMGLAYIDACWIAEDMTRDAKLNGLVDAMTAPLAIVCRIPAGTLAGLKAKTRALAAWDEETFIPNDDPDLSIDERLRASLIRDLLAVRT